MIGFCQEKTRFSRTDMAKKNGEALGIKVKTGGNRRLQPIVDKFFYWLRASALETNRVSYWWANRMAAKSIIRRGDSF